MSPFPQSPQRMRFYPVSNYKTAMIYKFNDKYRIKLNKEIRYHKDDEMIIEEIFLDYDQLCTLKSWADDVIKEYEKELNKEKGYIGGAMGIDS